MECAFQKDLSIAYEIQEPCLLSCDEVVEESGYMMYLIVSIILIVVLALGGFAIYYYRMIRPKLREKETLVDWLRGRTKRESDTTVRSNVLKGGCTTRCKITILTRLF